MATTSPIDYSKLQEEYNNTKKTTWSEDEFAKDEALRRLIPEYASWHPLKQEEFRRKAMDISRKLYEVSKGRSIDSKLSDISNITGNKVTRDTLKGRNWEELLVQGADNIEKSFSNAPIGANIAREEKAAALQKMEDAGQAKVKAIQDQQDAYRNMQIGLWRPTEGDRAGKLHVRQDLVDMMRNEVERAGNANRNAPNQFMGSTGSSITSKMPKISDFLAANTGRGEAIAAKYRNDASDLGDVATRGLDLKDARGTGKLGSMLQQWSPGMTQGESALDAALVSGAREGVFTEGTEGLAKYGWKRGQKVQETADQRATMANPPGYGSLGKNLPTAKRTQPALPTAMAPGQPKPTNPALPQAPNPAMPQAPAPTKPKTIFERMRKYGWY